MLRLIRCTGNIFGNYNSVVPNTEIIMQLMNELDKYKFIPNVTNEIMLNHDGQGVPEQKIVKRIQLISECEGFVVNFTNNLIEFMNIALPNESLDRKNSIDKIMEIMPIIMNIIKIKGTRISLILNDVLVNDSNVIDLLPTTSAYDNNDLFEWNLRRVKKIKELINKNDEYLYIISNIIKGKVVLQNNLSLPSSKEEIDGIFVDFDINTVPENNSERIDGDFCMEFFEHSNRLLNEIEGGIMNA